MRCGQNKQPKGGWVLRTKIRRIEVDDFGHANFYFEHSFEPFVVGEFEEGSLTRKHLEQIEYEIQDFNSEIDLERAGL